MPRSRAAASLPSDPEQWVAAYGDALFRYALLRVRDRETALDLVQETLLAALRGRAGFAGRSAPKTWLTGILKHKIADHFRHARHDPAAPGADPGEDRFDPEGRWRHPPGQWAADPSTALVRKQFWEHLHRCLGDMSPRLAGAFSLRELEGMGTAELCKVLDTSATNVWVMLHRARLALRRCLEASGLEPEAGEEL